MNTTAETIRQKITHLPTDAQEEVLEIIKIIEKRYVEKKKIDENQSDAEYPLTIIARMSKDLGVTDFAENHDFYAHRKLED